MTLEDLRHIDKMRLFILLLVALGLSACQRQSRVAQGAMTLEEFIPVYNAYIKNWLASEVESTEAALANADESQQADLQRALDKLRFRQSVGDYLAVGDWEDIPQGLVWEDGLDQPEFADPQAKRGGVFNRRINAFPATFRIFGSESNGGFRSYISDEIGVGLVGLHPVTGKVMPGLAKRWAVDENKKTVYFELHEGIRYSDGTALTIEDFHRDVFVNVSDYVNAPYAKQYMREQIAQIKLLGDRFLAVTLPESKPLLPSFASLNPSPEEFYREYGPDFEERYQWRPVPTTGAYHIQPGDFVKGVSIRQTRVKEWWGDDKKFLRYRFNPDFINYTVIRDDSKEFELFKVGKIDSYHVTIPEYYYEKTEVDPVFKGYIEKTVFYHQYVQAPRGFYLNLSKPKLKDLDMRLGLHYSMNWEKVINVIHRGDYSRLQQFFQGYGEFTNSAISPRMYSISTAREHFAKAGYVEENEKGYLVNAEGQELKVSLSYSSNPYYTKMLKILKEEAKKVGLNLQLDAQDGSVFFKSVMEKQHEMAFMAWSTSPPFPRAYQHFHSSNAYDAEGNPKTYANNITCYAGDRMDELCVASRQATTVEEVKEVAMELQQLLHDEAIFIPSYAVDFYRYAYWRWLKWPHTEDIQFNVPLLDLPTELHVHWIDENVKEETLEAKRKGLTFPEKVNIYDQYRTKKGEAQ